MTRLTDLEAEIAFLGAEVRSLRAEIGAPSPATKTGALESSTAESGAPSPATKTGALVSSTAESEASGAVKSPGWSRRAVLLGAGAAVAGVTGAVASATPASAAAGNPCILGVVNDAGTATTTITTAIGNGNPGTVIRNTATGDGLQVVNSNSGNGSPALHAITLNNFGDAIHAETRYGTGLTIDAYQGTGIIINSELQGVQISTIRDHGIESTCQGGNGDGIRCSSTNGQGIDAKSTYGYGVYAHGGKSPLLLSPSPLTTPPVNDYRFTGEVWVGAEGDFWVCVEGSAQGGVFRKLAGRRTAGALHVLPAPVRVYDSRSGTTPSTGPKTPLSPGMARTLDLKLSSSGVPAGATAAMVTCLLVNATAGSGNFTVWAQGAPRPLANSMVWGGSAGRFSTPAVTALDAQARCQVSASIATDLVLDVVGYYI